MKAELKVHPGYSTVRAPELTGVYVVLDGVHDLPGAVRSAELDWKKTYIRIADYPRGPVAAGRAKDKAFAKDAAAKRRIIAKRRQRLADECAAVRVDVSGYDLTGVDVSAVLAAAAKRELDAYDAFFARRREAHVEAIKNSRLNGIDD